MMKGGPALMMLLKGDKAKESEEGGDESTDYVSLLQDAFPNEEWTDERAMAFKEAVMACMGEK